MVGAMWANPYRAINRWFAAAGAMMALWQWMSGMTAIKGIPPAGTWEAGTPWYLWTNSVGVLALYGAMMVVETTYNNTLPKFGDWFRTRRTIVLSVICLVCFFLPHTGQFIPPESTRENRLYGWAYYAYVFFLFFAVCGAVTFTVAQYRRRTGPAQMESLVVAIGIGLVYFIIFGAMLLRTWVHVPRMSALAATWFVLTAVYLAHTHRLFGARELFLLAAQKLTLVALAGAVGAATFMVVRDLLGVNILAILIASALALGVSGMVQAYFDRTFGTFVQIRSEREALYKAAQGETEFDPVTARFTTILEKWARTNKAIIWFGDRMPLEAGGVAIGETDPVYRGLRRLRWVTMERLDRERPHEEKAALAEFMRTHEHGMLVHVSNSPEFNCVIGVGNAVSRNPFTSGQVEQLIEMGAIISTTFERLAYLQRARRSDQLATVGQLGASLAHEIRNPIAGVKMLVQDMVSQADNYTASRLTRACGLMTFHLANIDKLTGDLMNLAKPQVIVAADINLTLLLEQISAAQASLLKSEGVDLRLELPVGRAIIVHGSAEAITQTVLNCTNNSMQVLNGQTGERWIKLSLMEMEIASGDAAGRVAVVIEDNGPGIDQNARKGMFVPFKTSKSGGFGLGLAFCHVLLAQAGAVLAVDPKVPGKGAVFRIELPVRSAVSKEFKELAGPEKRPIPEAELRQRIINCKNLSSLLGNITALAKLFRDQSTSIEEFSKVISRDPALTTRLLRMANSAFFGFNTQINTIDGAVLHLGLSNVRLLMTTAPLIEDLDENTAEDGTKVSWREFWLHSLGCAYATREILNQFDLGVDNDTDYLSGLLHNIGKLFIAQIFPAEFTQLSQPLEQDEAQVLVAERELLGWDHAAIGAFFLATHRIPLEVIEAVRYHHDSLSALHHPSFAAATQLADIMVYQAGLKGGAKKRSVLNERELMELPCLVQLWPHKGPLLNLKMRKLTASIGRLPDLCKTLLSGS
jgi:HD-like signal output (HDOD) protein/signal transduction histidine kinase